VIIKQKIEITILPAINEIKKKSPGVVAVILVLYLPPILHRLTEGMDIFQDIFA